MSLVAAERRGAPYVSTPFSTSEQALFGQSHSEDCLFGSSSSVFYVPPEEDLEVVKEVKATTPLPDAGRSKTMPFVPKPAFIKKDP